MLSTCGNPANNVLIASGLGCDVSSTDGCRYIAIASTYCGYTAEMPQLSSYCAQQFSTAISLISPLFAYILYPVSTALIITTIWFKKERNY